MGNNGDVCVFSMVVVGSWVLGLGFEWGGGGPRTGEGDKSRPRNYFQPSVFISQLFVGQLTASWHAAWLLACHMSTHPVTSSLRCLHAKIPSKFQYVFWACFRCS